MIDGIEKVDTVFADAVERHIIFADTMDTKWEIDLSGMSLPVSCYAFLILKEFLNMQTLTSLNYRWPEQLVGLFYVNFARQRKMTIKI